MAVTFTSNLAGTPTPTAISKADAYEITRQEVAASNGFFTGQERVYEIAVSLLGATVPKEGDTVTDSSSVIWSVIVVSKIVYETIWRLVCKRER